MSARSARPSIAAKTRDRKPSAAMGLRSKYQRKASRISSSASGRISTLKRLTGRQGAPGRQAKPGPLYAPLAGLRASSLVRSAKPQKSPALLQTPDCQSMQQLPRSAPPPADATHLRASGLHGHSWARVYQPPQKVRRLTCLQGLLQRASVGSEWSSSLVSRIWYSLFGDPHPVASKSQRWTEQTAHLQTALWAWLAAWRPGPETNRSAGLHSLNGVHEHPGQVIELPRRRSDLFSASSLCMPVGDGG